MKKIFLILVSPGGSPFYSVLTKHFQITPHKRDADGLSPCTGQHQKGCIYAEMKAT